MLLSKERKEEVGSICKVETDSNILAHAFGKITHSYERLIVELHLKNPKAIKTIEDTCKGIFQSNGTNLQGGQISLRNRQTDTKNCNNVGKGMKTRTTEKLAASAKTAEIYQSCRNQQRT
jgi:ribosomal protein L27